MALTTEVIITLVHRKPELDVTVRYVNNVGEESVRTLTSMRAPEKGDNGVPSVLAFDADKGAWRRFATDRMEVLSVWDVDADGERRLVDPGKLLARAFASRLEETLERVIGTNVFDSVMTAELSDALDDARRIRRLMVEVTA
jgi:hypothetical protein